MKERLQKLMARADLGSRRACEQMIADGRVTINGRRATLGDQADLAEDDVRVDGTRLKVSQYKPRYFVFNKPKNVLSVNSAPHGDDRPIVRDLIPVEGHLFTIGRLDAESEGLMVLTNDGDIAHKLAHPSFEHTKTYKVTVYGHPTETDLQQWEEGVWVDDKRTARCYVRVLEKTPKMTTLRIVMTEGRKRQIRRVASQLGYPVQRLVRTHIGQLGLGTLVKGGWYELTEEEVAAMLMPAEELRYIKRRKRTFRPKSTQETPPMQAPLRHQAPAGADRSRPPRAARPVRPGRADRTTRPPQRRRAEGSSEETETRPEAPARPTKPAAGKRPERPQNKPGGRGRNTAITKTPARGNNRGQRHR
jgi:pseudouridine synthase